MGCLLVALRGFQGKQRPGQFKNIGYGRIAGLDFFAGPLHGFFLDVNAFDHVILALKFILSIAVFDRVPKAYGGAVLAFFHGHTRRQVPQFVLEQVVLRFQLNRTLARHDGVGVHVHFFIAVLQQDKRVESCFSGFIRELGRLENDMRDPLGSTQIAAFDSRLQQVLGIGQMVRVPGHQVFGVEHLFQRGLAFEMLNLFDHRRFPAAFALADQAQPPQRGVAVLQCVRAQAKPLQVQLDRVIEIVRNHDFLGAFKESAGLVKTYFVSVNFQF